MKAFFLAACLLFGAGVVSLVASLTTPTPQISWLHTPELIGHSVFKIDTPMWVEKIEIPGGEFIDFPGNMSFGTAFLMNWQDQIGLMTAWHVVRHAKGPCTVTSPYGGVVAQFKRVGVTDLAWAPLIVWPKEWIPLHTSYPPFGEICYQWGYPGKTDLSMSSGRLLVAQTERLADVFSPGGTYLGVNAIIYSGYSGGPALDKDGRVFGVVVLSYSDPPLRTFLVQIP
jgi:S1-C subfamily serine protease